MATPSYKADEYRRHRPPYPQRLLDYIMSLHHGAFGTLLDVGCGPAIALSQLAGRFDRVIGTDVSSDMVEQARELGIRSRTDQPADFFVASADEEPMVPSGSVDLVISATAAHYFPPTWWNEMARVVKPGGTVAVWTYGLPQYLSDDQVDGRVIKQLERDMLVELRDGERGEVTGGAAIALGQYDDLPLPDASDERWSTPVRKKFDVDTPSDPELGFMLSHKMTIDKWLSFYKTNSIFVGWTQRHADLVATPSDPIVRGRKLLRDKYGYDDQTTITHSKWYSTLVLHRR